MLWQLDADLASCSAIDAGPHSAAGAQAGTDRPPLDPERGTTTTVELPVLGQETNIVAHTDLTGEGDVPVRQLEMAPERLSLGQGEQVGDPFASDPDHRSGPPAPTAPTLQGWGC